VVVTRSRMGVGVGSGIWRCRTGCCFSGRCWRGAGAQAARTNAEQLAGGRLRVLERGRPVGDGLSPVTTTVGEGVGGGVDPHPQRPVGQPADGAAGAATERSATAARICVGDDTIDDT
jgi:hypothetical protein